MARLHKDLKIPDGVASESPFVEILDPATGTATFLVEVSDVIHSTLAAQWKQRRLTEAQQRSEWNQYVPKHLLPRLHGYELMMAPYAIAHMKIGLKLYETGYRFGSDERVRVYLTNTLEPASDDKKQREFEEWAPALAHEAHAVNAIKRKQRFTVVVGNPPYAGLSANLTPDARAIVECYKFVDGERIREKGALQFEKNLQDDYVKFFAWSEKTALSTGVGILSFISNNGFLETPTLRGMRWHLLNSFSTLYLLDLHGSTKRPIEGDQNVFDIQQGVAISLFARNSPILSDGKRVWWSDILGSREAKYKRLSDLSLHSTSWDAVTPTAPFFQFLVSDRELQAEYGSYISLPEAMPVYSSGTETGFDSLMVDFTKHELLEKIRRFVDPRTRDAEIAVEFAVGEGTGRKLLDMRSEFREDFDANANQYCLRGIYRVFDTRYYYYKKEYLKTNSLKIMRHLIEAKNIALVAFRQQSQDGFQHIFVTNKLGDKNAVSLRTREINYYFPLMLLPERHALDLKTEAAPNFSIGFLRTISRTLGFTTMAGTGPELTPEDILHYVYAVYHSPCYRGRYADFLKIDFPRFPLTAKLDLFRALARLGSDLAAFHLLDSQRLGKPHTTYIGPTNPEVEKVSYARDAIWLDRAQTRGFRVVSEAVWKFHIGGYQVCEKWLKDRKGRSLSKDDIAHYQTIVVALSETIRIMAEIDKVIEAHGGWPDAFITSKN
jgi:predicted helicase